MTKNITNMTESMEIGKDYDGLVVDTNFDKLVSRIKSSGYAPAVEFLLESHLPVVSIFHTVFIGFQPFLIPFVSSDNLLLIRQILENSKLREEVLSLLNA